MNSPALRRSWEGQVVDGRFPLRQWLGTSDHSTVFLTELGGSLRKAAIKLVTANTLNVDQLARWRPCLRLSHPHLLRLFDMGRCEIEGVQLLYLVMEYAEENLSQILPQRALSPAEAAELLSPTLDALSYLHGKGFVHAAIKPSNIHAADDQLKLSVDRLYPAGQASDKAQARTVYDAPELTTAPIAPAADLWSLGITIVEALTQHPPASLATREPVVPDQVPEPFREIAHACLTRDPRQRLSIADIRSRLQSGLLPATTESRQAPAQPTANPEPKPPKWHILVPITAVAILIAILAPTLFRRNRPSTTPVIIEPADTPPKPSPTPRPKPSAEPSNAVSSNGEVLRQVLPDVARSARNTIQGKIRVSVRVDVDPSGKVTSANLTSPGPSQYFARLALQAAHRWEFEPPQVNGQTTPSAWLLRFRFGRSGTEVSPVRADR
jgi:TonB family protein